MTVKSFKPEIDNQTKILILGTMPGEASLAADKYYAHPRNAFWKIMADVLNNGKPFENYTALMRAPSGEIITQFELHSAESTGLIKYDILSVEALDKIHICLDLLCKDGLVEEESTLKETYEKVIGIYNLIRDDKEMWKMCWDHKVLSLF